MHFTGREHHTVDAKGRASMPARFREVIEGTSVASNASRLMIVPWFGECVRIYPFDRWRDRLQALEKRLAELDTFGYGEDESDMRRLIYGMAIEIGMDGHGRFVFPQHVRDEAGFDREIYWVGLGDFIEVWDPERLHERLSGENARLLRKRLTALFSRDTGSSATGDDGHRAVEA
jgi:MraZ protein